MTPREREVLKQVVGGLPNKAIAEKLGIGEQAVKAHISRLFLKFQVASRAGLAVAAMSEQFGQQALVAAELARLAEIEHADALKVRAKLLSSLVGRDPAVIINSGGRVLLANPAFERIFAAAMYQDEQGVKLPADAEPLAKASVGAPAMLRFKLASGPRKGSWWHAVSESVQFDGGGVMVVFHPVRRPRRAD
ncbi:MAG TPA: helix-turn-helix transcriptional regulator [Candidatus Limnocylindria bacterium]|nr:helix-turn-helix transcriptional regulator [Candidatus Limnocylindria bacterium]